MKILIVSQYFYPEVFKINDLAIELQKLGYEVTVITGKPNYPKGVLFKGYGNFSKIVDTFNGITIYRLPIIPRGNGSGVMLLLNYISFALIGSLFSLFHRKKYSFSFVYAVSPILAAFPAIVHRLMYGTKLKLWVLDLWPESVFATGRMKSKRAKKILSSLVSYIYEHADMIYFSSREMKNPIIEKIHHKHLNRIKMEYLPNWAEDIFKATKPDLSKYSAIVPEGFIIMYAGNIGYGQDIPSIIKGAQLLKDEHHIKFVFLGDGSEITYIREKVAEYKLEKTVYLLGSYPVEEMPHFFAMSNALLVTLRNEYPYLNTVPGRLQSYMASSRPILGMISGEAAEIINDCNCGLVANAGDYESFAKNTLKLSSCSVSELKQMGQNGFDFFQDNFTIEKSIIKILA